MGTTVILSSGVLLVQGGIIQLRFDTIGLQVTLEFYYFPEKSYFIFILLYSKKNYMYKKVQ